MKLPDLIEKISQSAASYLVVSLLGGILWLVRRVFTNQKQIELLQQRIDRDRDREDFQELKADVKELLKLAK